MDQKDFDLYIALKPNDDPHLIPDVYISGTQISPKYQNYYLKKLDSRDPRAAILGKYTSCCQHLGGNGQSCAIHGIENPDSGFYVLCNENDEILSQSWARREENEIVYDSTESNKDFNAHHETLINDFFVFLSNELVTKHNIERVSVGTGPGSKTSAWLGTLPVTIQFSNTDDTLYTDTDRSRVIAQRNNNHLLQLYIKVNPNSQLKQFDTLLKIDELSVDEFIYFLEKIVVLNDINFFTVLLQNRNIKNETVQSALIKASINKIDFLVAAENYVDIKKIFDKDDILNELTDIDVLKYLCKKRINLISSSSNTKSFYLSLMKNKKLDYLNIILNEGIIGPDSGHAKALLLEIAIDLDQFDYLKIIIESGVDLSSLNKNDIPIGIIAYATAENNCNPLEDVKKIIEEKVFNDPNVSRELVSFISERTSSPDPLAYLNMEGLNNFSNYNLSQNSTSFFNRGYVYSDEDEPENAHNLNYF